VALDNHYNGLLYYVSTQVIVKEHATCVAYFSALAANSIYADSKVHAGVCVCVCVRKRKFMCKCMCVCVVDSPPGDYVGAFDLFARA